MITMHKICKLKASHILILQQEQYVKIFFTMQHIKITNNINVKTR